jgi:hypothetical protein
MQLQQFFTPDSSSSFLQNIKQHSSYLDFVLVYTHGSSGFVVQQTEDGHVVVSREVQGPRLIFSQSGYVPPDDLIQLAVDILGKLLLKRPSCSDWSFRTAH